MDEPKARPTLIEETIAGRIAEERERRGWSYRVLSRELEQLEPEELRLRLAPGALQKIEVAGPDGKRRRITVDEAISFAAVFGVPVGDWLMTTATQMEVDGWVQFLEAAESLNEVRNATQRYLTAMRRTRAKARNSAELRNRIEDAQKQTLTTLRRESEDEFRPRPGGWYNGDKAVPLTLAARDALGSETLASDARWWTSTREMDYEMTADLNRELEAAALLWVGWKATGDGSNGTYQRSAGAKYRHAIDSLGDRLAADGGEAAMDELVLHYESDAPGIGEAAKDVVRRILYVEMQRLSAKGREL